MTTAEKLIRAKADIDAVYEAGKAQGGDTEAAFNEGKLAAERERFEVLQQGGKAYEYREMFAGRGWTDESFKPIYNIVPTQVTRMFAFTGIKNLKADLERQGVILDLSKVTGDVAQMFANSLVTDIGVLNISNAKSANYLLQDASQLVNVEKVILSSSGNQTFTQAFGYNKKLVEIRFEGVIGNNIEFKQSTKLSADSLESIVTHLSDTVTGKTITFPNTAESTYNAKYGDGAWATLLSTKQNWSIAYA